MNDKSCHLLSTSKGLNCFKHFTCINSVLIKRLGVGFAISTAMGEGAKAQRGEDIGPKTHSFFFF